MKLYREVEASEKYPYGLEPIEITEEDLYNTINGLIWLGDGGKIQGVPDIVEAILSKLK